MLTHYYQSEHFAAQIRAGPGGSYMDEFAQALWEAGYTEITARRHIRAAQYLVHWAHRQHVPVESLDEGPLQRFRAYPQLAQAFREAIIAQAR
jgi:integrase/recombinase XerD